MFKLSDYDFYEVNEEKLEYYTEVQVKFELGSRDFLLKFDKEATLEERTLSMNCSLSELIYITEIDETIEIEDEDKYEVDEILSYEVEQHIIDLVETTWLKH